MKIRNAIWVVLVACGMCACTQTGVKELSDGIIVTLNPQKPTDVQKVRLQVMGDQLIRVSATNEKQFPDRKSLIIVPQSTEQTPFSVEKKEGAVTLSTAKVNATVNTLTGEVVFTDSQGKVLLAENKGGGKTFTPIEVEGKKEYSIRQVFESPEDEAFYGLGQHHAGEFNYKGKNEELFQYNSKVSLPFIISNKGYGILWDSYSLSRFGNPEEYKQIGMVFKLYDKDGKEGALTGSYMPQEGAKVEPLVRREESLYFQYLDRNDHLTSMINLPKNYPLGHVLVTYEGEIEPPTTGDYFFNLYAGGYAKVYLNNELVLEERFRQAWNSTNYKFTAHLEGQKRVPIRIEWNPDGDATSFSLRAYDAVPQEEQTKQSWWSEMNPQIDYYFIAGENMDEVISGYRTLTGKSPIMPKWAMGFWQCRQHYHTQYEVTNTLKEFRERQIPIDNIVQDWYYWKEDTWGSHEFDPIRYPKPQQMIDSIHAMNGHLMISVWPKFYATTEHFKEFQKNGWMHMLAVEDSIRDWVGPGYIGSFYDAYSADARKLFWNQMNEHLFSKGIDAWWMDASEPDFGSNISIDYWKELTTPNALGSSTEYLNAYALMNAEAVYDGQRSVNNDQRVFLLTRSGFPGLQRYSTATWSGDIGCSWDNMKAQITAGLNFSVAGIPWWTMDIGGFSSQGRFIRAQREFEKSGRENEDLKEWREMYARWFQFGAFCPLFRSHGEYPWREAWNIAPDQHPAYQSIVYYTKLRYRLLPYIYSLAGMTFFSDYTVMRPLVMDFMSDTNVNNVGDQFMFGPSIMACPVYTYGARSRDVYLPNTCGWYDLYTGKYLGNGKQTVAAPYEKMPLMVREGAIIPFGPAVQYSSEKPADVITLFIYKGQNGKFTLYEDEGVNYNYEKGAYATIPFEYNEQNGELTIGDRQGEFNGMLKERTFNVVAVSKDKPQVLDMNVKGQLVQYDGTKQIVKL